MHKNLGDWHRQAGMEPSGELLPKRWAAIEEYEANAREIASLTRLFYQLGKPNEQFVDTFRAVFQKADPAFRMRGNENELRVLAGAKLVDLIERSPDATAALAALSLVCASAQNLRTGPCVPEIPETATAYLRRKATQRALPQKRNGSDGPTEEPAPPGESQAQLKREFQTMQAELGIVAEETNILWWLFSEHSRDELKRWADYSVPAAALMAGKELADLTRVLPGPPAASAFLDRVIRCANRKPPASISVVDAINGVALDWRQKYTETSIPPELEDIMPISFGIKASTATPENDTWLPGFLRTTGLRQESKLAPELLSLQVFLERLLRRAWELST